MTALLFILSVLVSLLFLPVYLLSCWLAYGFCLRLPSYNVRTFCSLSELVPNIFVLVKCVFCLLYKKNRTVKWSNVRISLSCVSVCIYVLLRGEQATIFQWKRCKIFYGDIIVVDLLHGNIYDGGTRAKWFC